MNSDLSFLIPTRDNPIALAALLATIYPYTNNGRDVVHLHIADASKRPVIAEPQISRMLGGFVLHYTHSVVPDVNQQRLQALSLIDPDSIVVCVDDDLMLDPSADYLAAHDAFAVEGIDCAFGITVDMYNDRGYPDFKRFGKEVDNHHFIENSGSLSSFIILDKLSQGFASPGHLITRAGIYYSNLQRSVIELGGKLPEIADDAAATLLAGYTPMLCTLMVAEHVGNQNDWWKNSGQKQFAVMSLVDNKLRKES